MIQGNITTDSLNLPGDLTVQGNSSVASLTASGLITGNVDGSLIGDTRVTGTTNSTSKETGALVVDGGVGIAKNVFIGGTTNSSGPVKITDTTTSASKDTGALVVEGGVGIEQNLNVGGSIEGSQLSDGTTLIQNGGISGVSFFQATASILAPQINATSILQASNSALDSFSPTTGALVVSGGAGVAKNLNVGGSTTSTGPLTIQSATESSNKDTGALIVEGGVGIERNLNIGGATTSSGITSIANITDSTTTGTGALVVDGGVGIAKNINIGGTTTSSGVTTIANISESTNTTSGALIVEGGVGISKNLNVGGTSTIQGDCSVIGNFTVSGNTDLVNVTDLLVDDNRIVLNANTSGEPLLDAFFVVDRGNQIDANIKWNEDQNQWEIPDFPLVTENRLFVNDITESNLITNGALVVKGGIGVAGNVNVGGNVNIDSMVESTSTTTGALVVDGGVGINNDLYVGGNIFANLTGEITTNDLNLPGDFTVQGNSTVATLTASGLITGNVDGSLIGDTRVTGTTNSTSTTTGALVVDGGVGINNDLYVGGRQYSSEQVKITKAGDQNNSEGSDVHGLVITSGQNNRSLWFGVDDTDEIGYINCAENGTTRPICIQTRGSGVSIGKTTNTATMDVDGSIKGNNVTITDTTTSTTTTSGALRVAGGVGIAENLNVGGTTTVQGDCNVIGNFTVSGNTDLLNVTDLLVDDNKIILNANTTGAPVLDAFLSVDRGDQTDANIKWNEDQDRWDIPNFPLSVENGIYNSTGTLFLQGGAPGGSGANFEIRQDGYSIIDSDSIVFRRQDASTGTTLDVRGNVDVSGDINIGSLFPVLQSNKTRITYGLITENTSTSTQSYGVTYSSAPVVFTQVIKNRSEALYVVNIWSVSTTAFNWRKLYIAGTTGVLDAVSEDFYWIAIGQID